MTTIEQTSVWRPRYVLGVNTGPHDGSAVLLRDAQIVAMVEQERLSRNRYARGESPRDAVRACLGEGGIGLGQLDAVAVGWDVPTLAEIEGRSFCRAEFAGWLFGPDASAPEVQIHYVDHHVAHAAAAFYTSGASEAAILVADGRGESAATTLAVGGAHGIDVVRQWGLDSSLGHLYGWAADWAGLSVWGAGKLMGLSAYGQPRQPVPLSLTPDGYTIDAVPPAGVPVRFHYAAMRSRLHHHFRTSNYPFCAASSADVMAYADFAASVQQAVEDALLHLARIAKRETGLPTLVLAGGVALNCSANGRLIRSGLFRDIWVPPFPHDAGVSLGAALEVDRELRGPGWRTPDRLQHAFWAPVGEPAEQAVLDRLAGLNVETYSDDDLASVVSGSLAEGRTVAWFQGRAEVGPRALGARSILCDPSHRHALPRINRLKGREAWRPLGPAVLADEFSRVFDGDPQSAADFMLAAWPVRESARRLIPAAVHVDGSARPQRVHPEQRRYHAVLRAFADRTGVPALINTSLNVAGDPPALSRLDAVDTFLQSDLDVLVLDDLVARKPWTAPVAARGLPDRHGLSFTPWSSGRVG